MNILSSLLYFIGTKLIETYGRTRNVFAKGQTYNTTFYGAYGFVGANKVAYIIIPMNLASDVASLSNDNIESMSVSMRTVTGSYLGGSGGYVIKGVVNGSSVDHLVSATVPSDQPFVRINVQSNDFDASIQHTPISGNVTIKFKLT